MASNEPTPVTVTILGKEYRVACPPDERAGLEASARFLDAKMREIRDRGRTSGTDIAIVAALNITHELLLKGDLDVSEEKAISNKLKNLQSKIESALSTARQIEI